MAIKLADILKPEDGKICVCNAYWALNENGEIITSNPSVINGDTYFYYNYTRESLEALLNRKGVNPEDYTILFVPVAYIPNYHE